MFRRILLTALLAGGIAGLFASALQAWQVLPLLHAAEDIERGPSHGHDGAGPWEPADGLERTGYTVLANLLTGIGFALMLGGAMALRGRDVDVRRGVLWGLAGYGAFALAPALGLPPELPGTMAADIEARQAWWLATTAASAAGIALLVLTRRGWLQAVGAGLLVLPHLWGAPQPEGVAGLMPAELAARYAAATLVTTALFWVVLGGATGHFFRRLGKGV